MTTFERLVAVATGPGPVMEKARALIGEDTLALLIAKTALADTSEKLSATTVAEVLGIARSTADDRIDRACVKKD
jgi:hypothetical protein